MPLLAQPKAGRSFCYLGRPSDGSGTAIRCITGEMAEWLKARAWKVRLPERVTGVRIPLSPPLRIGGGAAASSATAASEACFGELTVQMMQGPKGRQSAMKPSPMGKADEGGQSLFPFATAASEACFGELTVQMILGPQGRRSAMKPSPTGKADRREANPVNAIVPFTPHRRSAANCHL